jgi:outer membrane lipoprotein-sorting protein
MVRTDLVVAVAALIVCGNACLAGETVSAVEKMIAQRRTALASVQFREREVSDDVYEKDATHSVTESCHQYARVDGKTLTRVETVNQVNTRFHEGHEETRVRRGLLVDDGNTMYTMIREGGNATVLKHPHVEAEPLGGQMPFAEIREKYRLEMMPDEMISGREAWVIRASPRARRNEPSVKGENPPPPRCMWFEKQTGIMIKQITYDASGRVAGTRHVTDIRINPEIPPARFHFEIPPGANVLGKEEIDAAATRIAEEVAKGKQQRGRKE